MLWFLSRHSSSPVRVIRDGSYFRAEDARGDEVWSVRHGVNPRIYRKFEDPASGELGQKAALIMDSPGERAGDAVSIVLSRSSGFVECRAPDGRLRWRFQPGRDIAVGDRQFGPLYTPAGGLLPLNVNGETYIGVISYHRVYYPCQIAMLDPADGSVVGEYWHPGFIMASTLLDETGDGTPELIAGGFNNPERGPGHPGLVVLKLPLAPPSLFDPKDPFGFVSSPSVVEAVLFPNSELASEADSAVISVVHVPDSGLAVEVLAGKDPLFYHFDTALNLERLGFSDLYRTEHRRLLEQGILDRPLGPEEVERMSRLYRCRGRNPNGNAADPAAFFAEGRNLLLARQRGALRREE